MLNQLFYELLLLDLDNTPSLILINQPWEMTYNGISPKVFSFPILSTLLEKVKHYTLGKRN